MHSEHSDNNTCQAQSSDNAKKEEKKLIILHPAKHIEKRHRKQMCLLFIIMLEIRESEPLRLQSIIKLQIIDFVPLVRAIGAVYLCSRAGGRKALVG